MADADTAKAYPVVRGTGHHGSQDRRNLQAGRLDPKLKVIEVRNKAFPKNSKPATFKLKESGFCRSFVCRGNLC